MEAHFSNGRKNLTFGWNRVSGQLTLGEAGVPDGFAYFDGTTRQWIENETFEYFASTYAYEIKIIASTLADNLAIGPGKTSPQPNVLHPDPCGGAPDCSGGGTGTGTCTGPTNAAEGLGLLKSIACGNAVSNAHDSCTNGTCFGCCWVGPCDCACVPNLGDIGCICFVQDQACGRGDNN